MPPGDYRHPVAGSRNLPLGLWRRPDGGARTNAYASAHVYTYPFPNANLGANTHGYANAYAHIYTHPFPNANLGANTHGHSFTYIYSNSDTDTDTQTHSNSNSAAHINSRATGKY